MKLELIGHDEKYALEQSLLTLFPGEKPVYGTVDKTADTRWARVTLTEEDERVQVTTELGVDGKSAAHSYDYPLSGTEYEKEGQRRHAVGISFFGAAKDLLGISPAWGSLTGVRPSKVALSLIREGGKKRAEKELQELYCVTPARARLAIEAADAGIRAAAELEPNDISLYVGIPFCPTRCAYCSFVAQSVEKSFSLVEPYLEALFDEITAAGQLVRELGLNVKSFYMGGGTPTTLTADQMDRLLSKLEQNFDFGNLAELTIEAGRPDTIDPEKLRVLRAHNTTRVSINPQTMEDNVLAAIGRRHTADDIRRAMEQVRAAGFPHVNMDLIAGLPEDTPEGFARSLDEVISMGADNITVHRIGIMLGRIADSIAVLFLKKNIINEDELPVYQYGMQVLICNIAGMLTVLIVGILISRLVESIIFITIYATLRIYTGGYHARTPLVCNIVFLGTYLVTVMLEALKVNNSVVWIMYLLSCLIILRFSPIENVNKELDEKDKEIYRNKSLIISTLLLMILLAGDITDRYSNGAVNNIMMNMYSDISLYMKLVIISIAVLMLYALFKDK